jgi:hypothetical protein
MTASQGCDIPDVEETICFGCPDTLAVLIQRWGRAGRNGQPAKSTVYIEKTTYEIKKLSVPVEQPKGKAKGKLKNTVESAVGSTSDTPSGGAGPSATAGVLSGGKSSTRASTKPKFDPLTSLEPPEGYEWQKKIPLEIRKFLIFPGCRRDYLNVVFANPARDAPGKLLHSQSRMILTYQVGTSLCYPLLR